MSNNTTSSDGSSSDEFVSEYYLLLVSNYATVGALSLFIFEYLLTLPVEVSVIWGTKLTGAQVLFYLNRYLFPVTLVLDVWSDVYPFSNITVAAGCYVPGYIYHILLIVVLLSIRGIFILRTFAIYHSNWTILVFLALIAISKAALDIYLSFILTTSIVDPVIGVCTASVSNGDLFLKMANIESYIAPAFDTIVLALTIFKTIKNVQGSHQLGIKNSLFFIILRDGILYYSALVVLSVTIIAIDATGVHVVLASIIAGFADVLQSMIVNQLILNLRIANHTGESTASVLPELIFASNNIIGNLGAPLYGNYDSVVYRDDRGDINMREGNEEVEVEMLSTLAFRNRIEEDNCL